MKRLKELTGAIGETVTSFEQQVKYDLLLAKQYVRADNERTSQEQQKIADDTELAIRHRAAEVVEKGLRDDKDKTKMFFFFSLMNTRSVFYERTKK